MAFMQPVVEHGEWFEIDGSCGIEVVPASFVRYPDMLKDHWYIADDSGDEGKFDDMLSALAQYIESDIEDVTEFRLTVGWGARLSAPGYMDCTEWTVHATEQDAVEYLERMYGDDEGGMD